jgi:serine/threonine protein kinase
VERTPFGRYRLIELLGRGGMGEVWKAFDTATERVVAVKVLPAQLAADPMFEQRFRREAFAAARLNEPHVVPIHNFGEIEGRLYVDMRLIEGQDLEHELAHGPLDPARAVKIVEQVASALNAAHRVGLVHRDVKPSNILLAEDDFAYLIDFGIARGAGETALTATGNVVGTWPYMAPERFSTGVIDTRSDIYALTCVLYECLTSSRPFPGDSVEQQIAGHLTTPPPRPSISRPGVTPELDAVIAAGMAKNPNERYGTTTELARAARAAIANTTPTKPLLHDTQPAAAVAPSAPTQAGPTEQVDPAWVPTQAGTPELVEKAWAPTQAGTSEHSQIVAASTQARPTERVEPSAPSPPDVRSPDQLPDGETPWPWWRRKAIVIPVAVVMMVAALATILVVVTGDGSGNGSGSGSDPRPVGPLDGTFAVEFGAPTEPNGQPYQSTPGGSETWVIKSACRASECVATASKVGGSVSTASTLVLDEINGRWEAVSATPGTCQNAPAEYWESMSLQSQPDGTLQGEFIVRSTTTCARNQQVTFTRTGDVQGNDAVLDPNAQPARVASPARGLHGRYQETDTYTDGNRSAEASFDIQTYCLRTGQRCLSYWLNPDSVKIVLFEQGHGVLANTSSDSECENGGRAHREINLQYDVPQPPQDPITLLTGRGHYTITGACPYNSDFDSRVDRTGN